MLSLLIAVIVTAIIFDYINGFHDAANAIATVVSTGVLPLRTAVIVAGCFNFVGAMAGTAVAKTIASGFANPAVVSQTVVLAALLGACIWNLLTWWWGIPSSSSHALIGGLGGAVGACRHLGVQVARAGAEGARAARAFAHLGLHRCVLHDGRADLDRSKLSPRHGARCLAQDAAALGLRHGVFARLQRRSKVDGHHHPGFGRFHERRSRRL